MFGVALTVLAVAILCIIFSGMRRGPKATDNRTRDTCMVNRSGARNIRVGEYKVEVVQETPGSRIACSPTECFSTPDEAREHGGNILKKLLQDGDRLYKEDAIIIVLRKEACPTCKNPRWVQVGAWNCSGVVPHRVPAVNFA